MKWFLNLIQVPYDVFLCVSLGVGTEPLHQPLPWSVTKPGRAGKLSPGLRAGWRALTARGELAQLLALFVPVLVTEKTSTFRAVALSPLHKV